MAKCLVTKLNSSCNKPSLKKIAFIVNIKTYNVDVLSLIFGRKFNTGDYFNGFAFCGFQSLVDTVCGIVIGKGKSRESFFKGVSDKFGRR